MISQEAYQAAHKYLQGVPEGGMLPAINMALSSNPNLSLTQLITAHRLLTQQQQQQQAMQAVQQAQQGGGLPGQAPQPTTVAQDIQQQLAQVNPQLEQQVIGSAAQPDRESGIAGLDTGDSFGQTLHAAGGGIIAFAEGEKVPKPDGDEAAHAKYNQALRNSGLQSIVDYTGALAADVARIPSQVIPWDWEEFERTGKLQKGYEKTGFFPITRDVSDMQAGRSAGYDKTIQQAKDTSQAAPVGNITFDPMKGGVQINPIKSPQGDTRNAAMDEFMAAQNAAANTRAVAPAAPTAPAAPATKAPPAMIAPSGAEVETSPAMKAAWDAVNAQRAKSEKMFSSIEAPAKMTRDQSDAAAEARYNAALARNGIDPDAYKTRVSELKEQAMQAKQDRDVDLYMAAAKGFFAMAGGSSQYALKNIADGLGVGTDAARGALVEYRKGEKARMDSIAALNQAHRADVLGREDKKQSAWEKYETNQEKWREAQLKVAEHLGVSAIAQGQILATREGTLQAAKDAAKARAQAASSAAEDRKLIAEARLDETKRKNAEEERRLNAQYYQRAEEKHPLRQKGSPLFTALAELESVQSDLAIPKNSKNPDLLTKENALRTRIAKYQDQIANESAAEATRMMNAQSKFKYLGVKE